MSKLIYDTKKLIVKKLIEYEDIDFTAFVVYHEKLMCIQLMHEGLILNENFIDVIQNKMIKTPELNVYRNGKLNPLSFARAICNESIPYYNILKFISQYTNSTNIYEKCRQILKSMPEKINGPILNPPDLLFLMQYNQYVGIIDPTLTIKVEKSKFNDTIYQPNPSNERHYHLYLKLRQEYILDFCRKDPDVNNYKVLLEYMCESHWSRLSKFEDLKHQVFTKVNLNIDEWKILEKIYNSIDFNEKLKDNYQPIHLNNELSRLDKTDISDMKHIMISGVFATSQWQYERMMKLYELKLVDVNDDISYYLLDLSVEYNNTGIINFLKLNGMLFNIDQIKKLIKNNNHYSSEIYIDNLLKKFMDKLDKLLHD